MEKFAATFKNIELSLKPSKTIFAISQVHTHDMSRTVPNHLHFS